MNIKEQGWIDYIGQRTSDVYRVFDFDGYQVDQLGARDGIYDAKGNYDDQQQAGFTHFLQEMKRLEPGKRLVMNAVGGFGNDRIAEAGVVDFYYTEVWDKGDFATISNSIRDYAALPNSRFGGGENPAVDGRERQVVLAAYMNYDHGKMGKGEFNTPGVLMANAAIHAWGGAHLELGEHMLNNEYFPNSNLRMRGELEIATIIYYDFITAYQNFLRGGGNFTGVTATTADERLAFNQWPPVQGQVATVGRLLPDGKTAVAHLLNYTDATTLDWCDSNADQAEQQRVDDVSVTLDINGAPATAVKAVWCATPRCRLWRGAGTRFHAGRQSRHLHLALAQVLDDGRGGIRIRLQSLSQSSVPAWGGVGLPCLRGKISAVTESAFRSNGNKIPYWRKSHPRQTREKRASSTGYNAENE